MNERTEAERLRVILHAFAYANPSMSMDEALPMILETEKKTVELEGPKVVEKTERLYVLSSNDPETVADFINTQPVIYEFVDDGKIINAIKEARMMIADATDPTKRLGLKDAKYGVERFRDKYRKGYMTGVPTPTPTLHPLSPAHIEAWINSTPAVLKVAEDYHDWLKDGAPTGDGRGSAKIFAIKEIRTGTSASLYEAKSGFEHWLKNRIAS